MKTKEDVKNEYATKTTKTSKFGKVYEKKIKRILKKICWSCCFCCKVRIVVMYGLKICQLMKTIYFPGNYFFKIIILLVNNWW